MRRPVVDLRQGRRRERNITVETQKGSRSRSPLGRGADLRLDVALPMPGEGLRAELGEFSGVDAAGRVPLHDAPDRKGRKMLIIKNKMGFMNFRSYSEMIKNATSSVDSLNFRSSSHCLVGSAQLPSCSDVR